MFLYARTVISILHNKRTHNGNNCRLDRYIDKKTKRTKINMEKKEETTEFM